MEINSNVRQLPPSVEVNVAVQATSARARCTVQTHPDRASTAGIDSIVYDLPK